VHGARPHLIGQVGMHLALDEDVPAERNPALLVGCGNPDGPWIGSRRSWDWSFRLGFITLTSCELRVNVLLYVHASFLKLTLEELFD